MTQRTASTLKGIMSAWLAGFVGFVALIAAQASETPVSVSPVAPAWYAASLTLALTLLPWVAGGMTGGFGRSAINSARGKPAWGKAQLRDTLITAAVVGMIAGAASAAWVEDGTMQCAISAAFGLASPEFGLAWIRTAEENPSAIWRWFRGGRNGGSAP